MGNVMLTEVRIAETDVTSAIRGYKHERTFGEAVGIVEIVASKSLMNLVTLSVGQLVEIWRGWNTPTDEKIFSGYIERFEPEGGEWKIIAKDKLYQLIQREVTHVYDEDIDESAGKISEIFKDLVVTYGGLDADDTSVQDSGSTFKLTKFVCRNADVFERCKKLADTLDWQFYYRADTDKVYFEPKGFVNNDTILQTGVNVIEIPKWRFDDTEMINELTLVGAEQLVETTELFNGNDSGSVFTLEYKPTSAKVYVSSALKRGGIYKQACSSGTHYVVDYENKKIIFFTPPPSGSNNVEIAYSYAIPTPVFLRNDESIATYGKYSKTIFLTDVKNATDAEMRATKLLEKYSRPFVFAQLKVRNVSTANLSVGQRVRVIDSFQNIDTHLIINRYIIRYPNAYDEVYVGDKEWRLEEWQAHVMEKIQRLEEEVKENQDMLLHIQSLSHSISVKRESLYIWARGIGSSFILGHPQQGMLGSITISDPNGIDYTGMADDWHIECGFYITVNSDCYLRSVVVKSGDDAEWAVLRQADGAAIGSSPITGSVAEFNYIPLSSGLNYKIATYAPSPGMPQRWAATGAFPIVGSVITYSGAYTSGAGSTNECYSISAVVTSLHYLQPILGDWRTGSVLLYSGVY